jgi:hypothetical protein
VPIYNTRRQRATLYAAARCSSNREAARGGRLGGLGAGGGGEAHDANIEGEKVAATG